MTGLLTGRDPARRAGLALAAAALSLLVAAATPAAAQDALPLSDTHRQWLEEEVLYIISDREKDAFGQLQSEAEREAFIEAFWRRRDPEPLTPENEFRAEHYERIAYANSRLGGETAIPGWMTDRGRIWITLGEPDERETFAAVPGLYPAELWFYLQRDEYLLPALYILFFQEHNAGPYVQFNHLIHLPEELLPAQSFSEGDSRDEAFVTLQEISPQLAHAAITMRADRGVTTGLALPDIAQLETQTLLHDITRAPHRLLDTSWVTGADAGRGLVETEYLFNFVPSAGVSRLFPGPASGSPSWFVHYAVEIEPQYFTLAREEDGADYFTRFDIQGQVTDEDGAVVYDFATRPFLRLTGSELREVGARPFAWRGMFPLIPGEFRLRIVVKNEARAEYTVFEDELTPPAPDVPFLSRPLLLHAVTEEDTDTYASWSPEQTLLVPNGRGVAPLGTLLLVATAAEGHGVVKYRVVPWTAGGTGASAAPVAEQEVTVERGFAHWTPQTDSWRSGRYVLTAAAGAEETSTLLDLTARARVARPWGLTDSFDPTAPGALAAALGEQWLRVRERAAAREMFRTALEEEPNLRRARLVLGRFALDENAPREAVRLLEPALAQAPDDLGILRTLGDAHRESGNPSRAAALYERSLALRSPDVELLNALGWSLAAAGEPTRAIAYLERSLEFDPEQEEVRDLLETVRASASPPEG